MLGAELVSSYLERPIQVGFGNDDETNRECRVRVSSVYPPSWGVARSSIEILFLMSYSSSGLWIENYANAMASARMRELDDEEPPPLLPW